MASVNKGIEKLYSCLIQISIHTSNYGDGEYDEDDDNEVDDDGDDDDDGQ